jgi:hypothetical protein
MRHADIATMWCSETSALFPRQIHALCALQDVREFFERQPCVQAWIDNPIWPRRLPQLPTHAVCDVRTSSENQDSPTHWTAAARPPKCVS